MVAFSMNCSRFCRSTLQLGLLALIPVLAWPQGTYTSSFPLTENPISESGKWINGGTAGLDWHNCRTSPGFIFGTQPGTINYDDSTCVLAGSWGPNQTAQGTIHIASSDATQFEEVEVRLHSTITAHSNTGYEVNCSVKTGNPYMQIVRWNGPLGNFTQLDGRPVGCGDGDVLKGVINGSTISAYKNGTLVFSVSDSTFTSGAPGIGLYIQGGSSNTNADFGFSAFTATDGTTQTGFSVTATPSSQTATQGSSAVYSVTVAPTGGFTGTVNLSATGQPSGTTATFNPSSITTSGSSTLTVSTLSSTPAASYPLTITGINGTTTRTAPATLVVSTAGGTSAACDLNKDGATNVVDVQLAVNKYLSCTIGPNVSSQSYVAQVTNGALGASCSSTAGAHTVFLSWTASTTAGVTYNVYRATASGAYTNPLNTSPISVTTFADCTVAPGQTYYYVIRSVDSNNNQSVNTPEVVAPIPAS
jgi:hypothetical protein